MVQYNSDVAAAEALNEAYKKLRGEISKVVIGQDETVRLLLTAIFCQGHCLLVGVPGLAKTLLIQTIAGQKYPLDRPFFVLATQNPIEQEGTYPLPEAQLDRFMFNVFLDYPSYQSELDIVKSTTSDERYQVKKVISGDEIQAFQHLVRRVPVVDNVVEYAVKLVHKTRPNTELAAPDANTYLEWGAGPRASQNLILAAKCNALLNGKYSPDIEDVRAVAYPILRHRIVRNFKAEAEGITVEHLIKRFL